MNQCIWFGLGNAQKYTTIMELCLIDEKFVYHKRCYFSQNILFFTLLARFPDNPWRIRVASGFEFSVCLFVCL